MDHPITLQEAWQALGYDVSLVIDTIAKVPREKRITAAYRVLEKAKKLTAKESARHHPDVGGDPEKFKRLWEGLGVIEQHTKDFELKMKQRLEELETKASERTVIVFG